VWLVFVVVVVVGFPVDVVSCGVVGVVVDSVGERYGLVFGCDVQQAVPARGGRVWVRSMPPVPY